MKFLRQYLDVLATVYHLHTDAVSSASLDRYLSLLEFIRPVQVDNADFELTRIGTQGDGGYLVPRFVKNMKMCISCGIGSNNDFELELANYMKVQQIDHTISEPPNLGQNMSFRKEKITKRFRASEIVGDTNPLDVIMKLDIEGCEWSYLDAEPIIQRFGVVVLELHSMEQAILGLTARKRQRVIKKLKESFVCFHIHANNCCGFVETSHWRLPRFAELTLVNRKLISRHEPSPMMDNLPRIDDYRNQRNLPEIFLGNMWSRNGIGFLDS